MLHNLVANKEEGKEANKTLVITSDKEIDFKILKAEALKQSVLNMMDVEFIHKGLFYIVRYASLQNIAVQLYE